MRVLHQVRRDEEQALLVAQHDIARHHGGVADPDRDVDSGQHHIVQRIRSRAAVVRRHAGRADFAEPEHAAVDHHARARRLPDVIGELVADERAAVGLAEKVDHDHIVRAEHIDDGLVAQPSDAAFGRLVLHALGDVGPQGHELHGERAPDQALSGIAGSSSRRQTGSGSPSP